MKVKIIVIQKKNLEYKLKNEKVDFIFVHLPVLDDVFIFTKEIEVKQILVPTLLYNHQ